MFSVALPIWLIIAAAGLPAICFLFVGIALIRLRQRKRKERVNCSHPHFINTPIQFNNQVYKQLVEQQIDAVFNTLITVIESERLKLKALVGNPAQATDLPTASSMPIQTAQHVDEETFNPTEESNALSDQSLGQSIAALSKKGMTAEQIARQLGLTQSEMHLAVKMNNRRKIGMGNRVRAIA